MGRFSLLCLSSAVLFVLTSCGETPIPVDRSLGHVLSLSFPEPFIPICDGANYNAAVTSMVTPRFLSQYDSLHRTLYTCIHLIEAEVHLERCKEYAQSESGETKKWLDTRLLVDEAFLHLRQRNIPLGIALAQIAKVNAEELDELVKLDALTVLAELQYMYLDHDASLATLSEARSLVSAYPDQLQREIKIRKLQIRNYNNNGGQDVSAAMLDTLEGKCLVDPGCLAEVYRFRAINSFLRGQSELAIDFQLKAVDFYESIFCPNAYSKSDLQFAVATLFQKLGNYEASLSFSDAALNTYNDSYPNYNIDSRNIQLLAGRAETIALVSFTKGDIKTAEAAFKEFESIHQQLINHTKFTKETHAFNQYFYNFLYSYTIQLCGRLYSLSQDEIWLSHMLDYISFYRSSSLKRDLRLTELIESKEQTDDDILNEIISNHLMLEQISFEEKKSNELVYDRIFKKQRLIKRREDLLLSFLDSYGQQEFFDMDRNILEKIVRHSREDDDARVFYYVGGDIFSDNKIRSISVFRGEVDYWEIEHKDSVFEKIDSLFTLNAQFSLNQNFSKYTELSNALYSMLFKPIFESVGDAESIHIVSDTRLNLLPFETLVVDKVNSIDSFKIPKYLVEYVDLSYGFFVDTVKAQTNISNDEAMLTMGWSDRGSIINTVDYDRGFPELPGAYQEVSLLKDSIGFVGGKYFLGQQASKMNFLSNAPRSDIIHLGLHGNSGSSDRLDSRLYFKGKKGIDSLFSYELLFRKINPKLVVLSSCESNGGKLLESEGVFSLARGFMKSGSESVISSLWSLDDQASHRLFKYFYKALGQNNSLERNLALSKRAYLKDCDGLYCHPFFWGGLLYHK